jgi:alkylhydroperoxidase family enzyme
VAFAARITRQRGAVAASDVEAVRAAGYSDAAIIEIVAVVAANTFTNYINEVLGTAIDFPQVDIRAA